MWKNIDLEQCRTFIDCQLSPGMRSSGDRAIKPAITISRLTGAGGHTVAGKLAEYLAGKRPAARTVDGV